MPLFQKSVLNKFIKSQDSTKIDAAYQRFSDIFLQADRQTEIRSMKEEEYQDGFLDDLFVSILGYIKRPNAGFNLVREKKNEADSKKADGAILKNDSPLAVIELKGTDTTDLDKVTNQGFGYKNNHKECVYVVISNFEKLRFFIHHAVDYIEFNLFTLTKEEFTTLWLCLHSDNLLDNIPAKIKAESVVKEEDITKNLYKDYSSFKQELWQDIVKSNQSGDPLVFYKKTQKLIDRFLFIFFAEDAGLLPPNSISRMVDRWKMLKEEDAYKPLYEIFKQYFGYINTGRPGKTPQDEIFAYNGGLMAEDEVLETVLISDEVLLKHVSRLTTYDFSSEVDVNILGHIFENSLNDIEAVTAQLEGQEIDKSKTKRKKDGVFYTPKYITKYIVDNTVGKLCDEKKAELNIIDEEYAKGRTNRKKETLKKLDENLQAYRNWLLDITICDPACGSGAFLNQALEYLMEEHRYIDELESQLLGAGFTFPGVENHILENNIFGVDINEESIEIAKLSLWLRTAQRGRKLTSLNNNIKCGNSLIDDPEVAGEKAFNWQQEFPTVFEKGGFDVVIGNPPYVDIKALPNEIVKHFFKNYVTSENRINLYSIFIEKGHKITKENGFLSFINPNSILINSSYTKIRKMLVDEMSRIVKLPDAVFLDASVETIIFEFRKGCVSSNLDVITYPKNAKISFVDNSLKRIVQKQDWKKNEYCNYDIYSSEIEKKLLNKIKHGSIELSELVNFSLGITPYDKYRGHSEEIIKSRAFHSLLKIDDNYKPLITGENITRYNVSNNISEYIKYGDWLGAARDPRFFTDERILIRQIVSGNPPRIYAGYTNESLYYTQIGFGIISKNLQTKYLLCLLNSKLITFYHKYSFLDLEKELFQKILIANCKKLPIKEIPLSEQQPFIDKAEIMLSSKKDFQVQTQKLSSYIISHYNLEKLPSKLSNWYELDFADFIKELNKAIKASKGVPLTKKDEFEWMELFEENKKKVLELKNLIDQTDREIDRMVYELYGLTEEEIKIVEWN